jgi:preprotein translocase subunit SecD
MRRTRGLWISILVVAALVLGSVAAFLTGTRPVLGLDLEGGVSVILSAPKGTPPDVMDQALENIRNRIDAFGTAEPILYVTGDTIEVQIPGLARGTIDQRPKTQYCILASDDSSYGCFADQSAAQTLLDGAKVNTVVESVKLSGLPQFTDAPQPFETVKAAQAAIKAMKIQGPAGATGASGATGVSGATGASGASGATGAAAAGHYCITGTGLTADPCYDTQQAAQSALDGISPQTVQNFCVQDADGRTLTTDAGAACKPTREDAQAILDGLNVTKETSQYCVVSSADKPLGCFLTHDQAVEQLQATGQDRLLQVIGQTARLEEREVLQTLAPSSPTYATTDPTCADQAQQETPACSFGALKDKQVVYFGNDGSTKYVMGPVEITGDAIGSAKATLDSGSQTSVGSGWQIAFTLRGEGSQQFSDATTRLVGKQLAIVVDRKVISAPTVDEAITNGRGVITGSFTEQRAKDLATQLNAGALPVELKTEQVLTVSPTLGQESLHQGIIAGIAGLILLALYLLFYYRILAIVAWLGMTIWAIFAFALIALAGQSAGYSLTLAGVAGLVISLGVTADSYIVFFERFKDEVHAGKSPRVAVQPAFKRAFRTIVAADIVTALAAVVLYLTAISSVRGFALTLGVSVGLDLFVVYFFKRPAVFLLARNEKLVTMRGLGVTSAVAAEQTTPAPAIAGGSK